MNNVKSPREEQLETRIEELKNDKKDLNKEIERLRQFRLDEVEKEVQRKTENFGLRISHLEVTSFSK